MTDPKKPADKESGADYEVGYGKPPRHTRFQPGSSGNPRGTAYQRRCHGARHRPQAHEEGKRTEELRPMCRV